MKPIPFILNKQMEEKKTRKKKSTSSLVKAKSTKQYFTICHLGCTKFISGIPLQKAYQLYFLLRHSTSSILISPHFYLPKWNWLWKQQHFFFLAVEIHGILPQIMGFFALHLRPTFNSRDITWQSKTSLAVDKRILFSFPS